MHKDATRIKAMNEPRLLTSSTHAVLAIVYSASGWYIILLKFPNDDHEWPAEVQKMGELCVRHPSTNVIQQQ